MTNNVSINENGYQDLNETKAAAIDQVIKFLQIFLPTTVAKRIVSILLIVAGVPNENVTKWTGSCDRSVRQWKKQIATGDISSLLTTESGNGRKSKFEGIESQVIEEIESGNYHTQQEIADMVKDKFGINVSLMAVSRFLKKTASGS